MSNTSNNRPIMISTSKNGLSLLEPVESIDMLTWNAPDTFKEEFLADWKKFYEYEREVGGNIGINVLSVLADMQDLLEEGKVDVTKSYDDVYNEVAKMSV